MFELLLSRGNRKALMLKVMVKQKKKKKMVIIYNQWNVSHFVQPKRIVDSGLSVSEIGRTWNQRATKKLNGSIIAVGGIAIISNRSLLPLISFILHSIHSPHHYFLSSFILRIHVYIYVFLFYLLFLSSYSIVSFFLFFILSISVLQLLLLDTE